MLNWERVEQDLRQLNERLTRVEHRLGLAHPDDTTYKAQAVALSAPPSPPAAPPAAAPVAEPPAKPKLHDLLSVWAEQRKTLSPEFSPPAEKDSAAPQPVASDVMQSAGASPPAFPSSPAPSAPLVPPFQPAPTGFRPPPPAPKNAKGPLELQIGMRWMAWAGALVVIVAVGFFVKLAYDLGWLGRLSAQARCLLTAGFGGLLLAGGELALRRINRAAAVSLFAAGLGTLYLTAFATFRYFNLVSEPTAFVLLAAVALVGVGLTVRGRMLTIGVLSLLGGYATPVLLQGASTFAAALPLYMTTLLAIALALSAFMPEPFRTLRYVALPLHGLLGVAWVLGLDPQYWMMTLSFLVLWWLAVTVEAAYAARRGQSGLGNAVVCLAATGWFVTLHCWLLRTHPGIGADWLGLSVTCVAAVACLIAFRFDPALATLRGRPRAALDQLALTHWVECAVLLTVAVALQFKGFGQTVGWLVMGLAYVEMGRRLPSRGVDRFGLLVGGLALLRLVTQDLASVELRALVWAYGGVTFTQWALLALCAIAAVHLAAWRLRVAGEPPRVRLPIVLCGLSVLLWLGWCALQCRGLAMTAGWLLAAAALIGLERFGVRQRYFQFGAFLLAAAAARWLAFDAFAQRFLPSWDANATWPLFNWQMAAAAVLCALGGWTAWKYFHRFAAGGVSGERAWGPTALWRGRSFLTAFIGLLLVALSFEVDRIIGRLETGPAWNSIWPALQLRALWWTLLWAAGGFAFWLTGRALRRTLARKLAGEEAPPVWRARAGWMAAGALHNDGWTMILGAAVAWLACDTFLCRLQYGVALAAPLVNLQFGVGLLSLLAVAIALWRERQSAQQTNAAAQPLSLYARTAAYALLAALGLWLGGFEIDRFCAPEAGRFADGAMARQTGLSIYGGLYAILLIAVGFRWRTAWTRYAGLALLSLTLGKVLLVDMAEVRYFYRVLSLLGVGMLLIGTSVAYAKLASRLLGERAAPSDPPRGG